MSDGDFRELEQLLKDQENEYTALHEKEKDLIKEREFRGKNLDKFWIVVAVGLSPALALLSQGVDLWTVAVLATAFGCGLGILVYVVPDIRGWFDSKNALPGIGKEKKLAKTARDKTRTNLANLRSRQKKGSAREREIEEPEPDEED